MGALVIELIALNVALVLAPFFLIYLVIGSYMHPESVNFAKVLIGVLFPLFFMVWFAGIVIWCDSYKDRNGMRVFPHRSHAFSESGRVLRLHGLRGGVPEPDVEPREYGLPLCDVGGVVLSGDPVCAQPTHNHVVRHDHLRGGIRFHDA